MAARTTAARRVGAPAAAAARAPASARAAGVVARAAEEGKGLGEKLTGEPHTSGHRPAPRGSPPASRRPPLPEARPARPARPASLTLTAGLQPRRWRRWWRRPR